MASALPDCLGASDALTTKFCFAQARVTASVQQTKQLLMRVAQQWVQKHHPDKLADAAAGTRSGSQRGSPSGGDDKSSTSNSGSGSAAAGQTVSGQQPDTELLPAAMLRVQSQASTRTKGVGEASARPDIATAEAGGRTTLRFEAIVLLVACHLHAKVPAALQPHPWQAAVVSCRAGMHRALALLPKKALRTVLNPLPCTQPLRFGTHADSWVAFLLVKIDEHRRASIDPVCFAELAYCSYPATAVGFAMVALYSHGQDLAIAALGHWALLCLEQVLISMLSAFNPPVYLRYRLDFGSETVEPSIDIPFPPILQHESGLYIDFSSCFW